MYKMIALLLLTVASPSLGFINVAGDYSNNGTLAGTTIELSVGGTFSGTGLLKAETMILVINNFAFTGTISCNGTCTIITKKPFDTGMFNKKGTGQFIIKTDSTLFTTNSAVTHQPDTTQKQASAPSNSPKEPTTVQQQQKVSHIRKPKSKLQVWTKTWIMPPLGFACACAAFLALEHINPITGNQSIITMLRNKFN